MAVIRNLVVKVTADVSELTKAMGTAQSQLNKAASNMASIGGSLTSSITLPLAAIGTTAVKTATEFEQSMANAASVSNATGDEFDRMIALARKMGYETVFSASQAADAMYYMASAGYKVEQMEKSIAPILNLASATQSELAFTTDTVIAALNQYGLDASEAERVTNVYAAAIGASQATMDKLATSMGYVGPIAHSLGWSIEEASGALSVLYNAGYDGSTAGTALRKAMSSLLNPTSAAQTILSKLGVSLESVNPETHNMAEIVDALGEAGMTAADALEVFGDRGGPGMMALIQQGGEAIKNMTEDISGTTSASTMAARQLDTFQGRLKLLKSQAEEVGITIGNLLIPMLSELSVNYISPAIDKFTKMSEASQKLVIKIGLIAASIGPLFLGLSKVLKLISSFAGIAKIAFNPLTIKIALIVGAVMLLVNVFKKLYTTNAEFKEQIDRIWSQLQGIFETLKTSFEKIGVIVAKVIEILLPYLEMIGEFILTQIADKLELVLPIIQKVLSAFEFLFNGIIKLLNGDFEGAWNDFKEFFIGMWDAICDYMKIVLNNAIKSINGFLNLIGMGINWLIGKINKIKIGVPDWIPIIGGQTIGLNIPKVSMPQIPTLASGAVIPPNDEFLAVLGDQRKGTNIEAPLDTLVKAFNMAGEKQLGSVANQLKNSSKSEVVVRFEGLSDNAFLSMLTPKVIAKAKNMGLI